MIEALTSSPNKWLEYDKHTNTKYKISTEIQPIKYICHADFASLSFWMIDNSDGLW